MSLLSSQRISNLRTPSFIVDLKIVRSNAEMMLKKSREWGILLRPHVKTHKTIELARLQYDPSFGGITVSTMAEARYFAEAGFNDITYAFPLGIDKIVDAWSLAMKIKFGVLVDHPDTLSAIIDNKSHSKNKLGIWIKIDSGYHRAGIGVDNPVILTLAKKCIDEPSLEFLGILTHAGQSYVDVDPGKLSQIAYQEAESLRYVAKKLNDHGINCPGLSLGSTPIASLNSNGAIYAGITEMRPGNYLFYDRYMAESGHCSMDDIACVVATRIVGLYPERNTILIDAGALAMSKDLGPTHLDHYQGGYGIVKHYPDLYFERVSQEHGLVRCSSGIDRFRIGQVLEIIPNHSCLTAALFSQYHLIEDGAIVDVISPVRGW
jgi:D-serine deaminase-like pyridoxal phosphate-dependent protein